MRDNSRGHEAGAATCTGKTEGAVTRDALTERVGELADRVVTDPRWESEKDDLVPRPD